MGNGVSRAVEQIRYRTCLVRPLSIGTLGASVRHRTYFDFYCR